MGFFDFFKRKKPVGQEDERGEANQEEGLQASKIKINLGEEALKGYNHLATQTLMSIDREPDRQREWGTNTTLPINVDSQFTLDVPSYSFSIIRIQTNTDHHIH